MVDVVSFYAPRPAHPFHRDYRPLLELQRESCQRFGCRQIVITDPGALPDFETFETEMPESLMPAILIGQRDYLANWKAIWRYGRDTILCGADCLLGKDPRPVFDGTFDLAVTTHDFADCILNTGAIYIPAGCDPFVLPFWQAAAASVGDDWGDDQRALATAIGATLDHGIVERGGRPVKFLPIAGHNMAPEDEHDRVDACIVHFRGRRKDWMAAWAARR